MGCVHTASCWDALNYDKLSGAEQDCREGRRAPKDPPALRWPQHSHRAQAVGISGKYPNWDWNTALWFFLFFLFLIRGEIFAFSLNHILVHSSCVLSLVFPPKGCADVLLHRNCGEFLHAGENPLWSSLEGALYRFKCNFNGDVSCDTLRWRAKSTQCCTRKKTDALFFKEDCELCVLFWKRHPINMSNIAFDNQEEVLPSLTDPWCWQESDPEKPLCPQPKRLHSWMWWFPWLPEVPISERVFPHFQTVLQRYQNMFNTWEKCERRGHWARLTPLPLPFVRAKWVWMDSCLQSLYSGIFLLLMPQMMSFV